MSLGSLDDTTSIDVLDGAVVQPAADAERRVRSLLAHLRPNTTAVAPFAAAFFLVHSLSLLILPPGAIPTWGGQRWLFGAASAVAGLGVLWLCVLVLPRTLHIALSLALVLPQVWLAIDRMQGGAYAAPTAYLFLALAVVLSAILRDADEPRGDDRAERPDLLAITLALIVAVQGWALLAHQADGARRALVAADVSPALFGVVFLIGGLGVIVTQLGPRILLVIASITCGGALIALNAVVAIEIDSVYWLLGTSVYLRGVVTMSQPWWGGRLTFDPYGLRFVIAAALITAAAGPALTIMGFVNYGPGFDPSLQTRQIVFGVASAGMLAAFAVAWWSAGRLSGSLRELAARIALMEQGARDHVSPAHASTEVQRIGATVERLVQALDREAAQREDAMERLRHTNSELDRALAAKDEFLSLVSHELRTPITTILGNADVLSRVGERLEDGDRTTALADVAQQADRLNRIIENLLLLARAEHGTLPEFEPLLIVREIAACVEEFEQAHPSRVIEVDVESGVRGALVDAEVTYLRQIIANLFTNAFKYSDEGMPITIRIARADRVVRVHVLDRGRGISAAEAAKLFDSFYRSDRTADVSGLGIGLAVCKRLVEAMGGTIWARSRDGGGADVGFELPRSAECSVDGSSAAVDLDASFADGPMAETASS